MHEGCFLVPFLADQCRLQINTATSIALLQRQGCLCECDDSVTRHGKLDSFHYEETVSPEMMLMGWMRTIMINTAIDRLRKDNFLPEIGVINDNIWIEDRTQGADQSLLYKELILEIKKLPPGYRAVFNMYVIDGFTHREIADSLKISVGTSKSNLSKARVLLQNFLKKGEQKVLMYATGK